MNNNIATSKNTMNCIIKKFREKKFPGRGGARKCAESFGVATQYWSDWEKGKRTPGADNQMKLADFFGITLAELRGEAQKSPPATAGGGQEANTGLIEAVFQLQETLSVFGQYLAAGKSADVFPEIGGLLGTVRKLQERLGDLRQLPENHDRTA